jgi:glycosyltransferase involved in cell wall biosynthesis
VEQGSGDRSRLRILQVVPTYLPAVRYGGPIRSVHALGRALVERGHDVHVYTTSMDGPDDLDVPLSEPVDIDGVKVRYFPVHLGRRLCWSWPMYSALRHAVASFDVVHLHSIFLFPTWAAARIASKAKVPYVVSPRGMLGQGVIRLKSRWVKRAWIQFVERRTLREAARVHVTAEIERMEIGALGLDLPATTCIPNGISWPESHVALEDGPFAGLRKPYALFLSRINIKKGLDRLLEAWRSVPDLTLIIAGNDESGYRRKLEGIVAQSGIGGRVRFLGPVADQHKWALYEHATLFILPSYSENFGNVVAEAMAMGCPIIVTPEVGLASTVHDSGAGLVVEGIPKKLAAAICALKQDAVGRRRMGECGRLTARRDFSWESAASQMEELYVEITVERGSDL